MAERSSKGSMSTRHLHERPFKKKHDSHHRCFCAPSPFFDPRVPTRVMQESYCSEISGIEKKEPYLVDCEKAREVSLFLETSFFFLDELKVRREKERERESFSFSTIFFSLSHKLMLMQNGEPKNKAQAALGDRKGSRGATGNRGILCECPGLCDSASSAAKAR